MRRALTLVLAALACAACATEPAPLDRTQPQALNKAMFQGEWNYKATVVDTDAENAYTFIGEETSSFTGAAFKVRWEITEYLLTAYRVPQRYRDAAGNLVENPVGQQTPILAFKVVKHYDIRYRYNSTTREDLNVIEENTDRPWDQREYMEVDWSQSLIPNLANPTVEGQILGEIQREAVAVYENVEFWQRGATAEQDVQIDTRKWNPATDPDIHVINLDTKETLSTKASDWYQLEYGPYMEPVSVRVRHSLMKAPPVEKMTYKPLPYGDDVFRRFGLFRTEYEVWDPERGTLENQKQYLANRWDFTGTKTLTWYASPSFQAQIDAGDTDLKDWALQSIAAWNQVLREATGRTDDPLKFHENEKLKDDKGQPVLKADGTPRWKYELGDLRWSFLNFTTKPQGAAPLGYGPTTPDSDTGELLNGTVNVYGDWADFVVRRAMDWYDVAAGNCTLDQVKDGYYFDPSTGRCDSATWAGQPAGGTVTAKASALTQASDATAAATPFTFRTLTPALMTSYYPHPDIHEPVPVAPARDWDKARVTARQMHDERVKHPTLFDAAGFASIAGTKYEAMMVPQANLKALAPYAPSADVPAAVAGLSPAHLLSPKYLAAMKQQQTWRSAQYDEPIMFEPGIHAFVEEMKGRPRAEAYRTLRQWLWYTSVLHEMGHTLGLRHNFRGSVDQPNFPTEYFTAWNAWWDQADALRAQYAPRIRAGDADAYQAYVQAMDDLPSTHNRYGSSSVMDYFGAWADWMTAVGSWDRGAMLFAYGNKVEIRDSGDAPWRLDTYQAGDFSQADPTDADQAAASGRRVRYYMFCSDEKLFDDLFCSHFDTGVTATEITRNFIRDARYSYFFKNFKRQSTQFEARRNDYYIDKWLWTYYIQAKVLTEAELSTMRYDDAWNTMWNAVQGGDPVIAHPETRDLVPGWKPAGGEDLLRGMLLYYYYLLYDVLGRPDYGAYQVAYDTSGTQYWDWTEAHYVDATKPAATVPAGTGWGWNDLWDAQADFQQYYPHLTRIGVELDKVIALEMLSVPAILNDPLTWEKANGVNFWNSLWTDNGIQAWGVIKGLITDNFSHRQNPWCVKCDAACKADPAAHPPVVKAYPVDFREALGGVLDNPVSPSLKPNRCGPDELPMRPAMDALFAIYPIYYGIAGASHPWYDNGLADHMDSQVLGGNHRFDIPTDAQQASFANASGTKTYVAVQTADGMGISYQLALNGKRIRDRIDMVAACDADRTPDPNVAAAVKRTCDEVLCCYYNIDTCPTDISYCESEGWDWTYLYDGWKYQDLNRIEAMLIMMQDMIDIAGHYQWQIPEVMGEE